MPCPIRGFHAGRASMRMPGPRCMFLLICSLARRHALTHGTRQVHGPRSAAAGRINQFKSLNEFPPRIPLPLACSLRAQESCMVQSRVPARAIRGGVMRRHAHHINRCDSAPACRVDRGSVRQRRTDVAGVRGASTASRVDRHRGASGRKHCTTRRACRRAVVHARAAGGDCTAGAERRRTAAAASCRA
jgi:hypothetical protein